MNLEQFSWDWFFETHWRKKPLVIRGGASLILSKSYNQEWLLKYANAIEALDPLSVKRGGNGVVFVQHIDRVEENLAHCAAGLGATLGFYRPWFDAVLTAAGSSGGIGCHYDDSDNFVLQQQGNKLWRIGHLDTIPTFEQRQRMMKVSGIGGAQLSEITLEVLLEPGDLLYIPLLWPHWGLTTENSLSLSLVCNSTNAARLMVKSLSAVMGTTPAGWEALPRFTNEGDIDEVFDRQWNTLTSVENRAQIRALWLKELRGASSEMTKRK